MIEDILFGKLSLPGEMLRVFVAIFGLIVTSYYDLFNKKNVPDNLLYAFLAVAFLVNLVFFESTIFWFSLVLALIVGLIGYVFYRLGQIGGADVFVLVSIVLLLPIHPSFLAMPFNLPFIFSLFIFSGVVFALFVIAYFGFKLIQGESKPKLLYALMFIPYLIFAYVYTSSFLFSPVYFIFVSLLLFSAIFFLMYRDSMMSILAEELPVSQLEPEDVCAVELMNKDLVSHYKIPRLLKQEDIDRLKKSKVSEIWVYTRLPPFLPFLLVGTVLALLFARSLILI